MQFGAKYHSFVRPKSLNFPVSFLKFIIPRPHVLGPFFELPVVCLKKVRVFEALDNFVIFCVFGGVWAQFNKCPGSFPSARMWSSGPSDMWEQSKVCIVLAWRIGGARMDGAGWMEGVDGVGSLLQVVRDMMEYDGVKQGFSPLDCPVCWVWWWRKWIASLWRARIALHALLPCWHGWIVGVALDCWGGFGNVQLWRYVAQGPMHVHLQEMRVAPWHESSQVPKSQINASHVFLAQKSTTRTPQRS